MLKEIVNSEEIINFLCKRIQALEHQILIFEQRILPPTSVIKSTTETEDWLHKVTQYKIRTCQLKRS